MLVINHHQLSMLVMIYDYYEETDLLTGDGVSSCAEIDDGATVEAWKDKVEAGTPGEKL